MSRSKPPAQPPRLSAGKRRVFGLVLLLFPLLFLAALEGGLRLAGYGESYPLFVDVPGYEGFLYQNRDVARRYFSREEIVPDAYADVFRATKNPDAFRIFVQGGSTAAGFPYSYALFSRMLEQRLRQSYDREIEVINTAMAAVNTYTLVDFADEIIAQKPDAVLIYAGHNEYYGALGVASTQSMGQSRTIVKLRLRAQKLRLWQAMHALIVWGGNLSRGPQKDRASNATLMEKMVADQSIAFDSVVYHRGLRQFRDNVGELLDRYRKAGIPVFLATLASNERFAPFRGGVAADAASANEWSRWLQQAAAAASPEAAVAHYDRAIAVDSLAGDAFFGKASALEGMRQYREARTFYLAAKDRDALRFRAPEAINQMIREMCAQPGVTLVDVQATLQAVASHGIIGSDLMVEHLHPNIEGYFRVAEAFYGALLQSAILGRPRTTISTDAARAELLVTPVDSLLGEYRVRHLMGSWPFQPPGVVDSEMANLQASNEVEQIALDLYHARISWYDALGRLSVLQAAQGNLDGALQSAMAIVQQFHFHPEPYGRVGAIFMQQGRYDEALGFLQASLQLGESPDAHYLVGEIYMLDGKPLESIAHFERARQMGMQHAQLLFQLASAYAQVGRRSEARSTLEVLLRTFPGHVKGLALQRQLQ